MIRALEHPGVTRLVHNIEKWVHLRRGGQKPDNIN